MASVYRDETRPQQDGTCPFVLSYTGLDGKQHRKRSKARREAQAWAELRRIEEEITEAKLSGVVNVGRDGRPLDEEPKCMTFGEFVENRFLPERRQERRPNTVLTDESRIKALEPYFYAKALRGITKHDIREFLTAMRSNGRKDATLNRYRALLGAIFSKAFDDDLVVENPVRKVKAKEEPESCGRPMTQEDEAAIHEQAAEWVRPIFRFAVHTGMREGEIVSLRWTDVNLEEGLIHVRAENAKGKRSRYIPILPAGREVLNAQRFVTKEQEYVFCNPYTGEPYTGSGVYHAFKRACKAAHAKMTEKAPRKEQDARIDALRFHDTRHTFASRLIRAGVSRDRVRDILGHRSYRMVDRYAHLAPDTLKDVIALVAASTYSVQKPFSEAAGK